jgi:hypothetical protein
VRPGGEFGAALRAVLDSVGERLAANGPESERCGADPVLTGTLPHRSAAYAAYAAYVAEAPDAAEAADAAEVARTRIERHAAGPGGCR